MVLLLYLLKGAGDVAGRAKLQKTVFLAEYALAKEGQPIVPHYKYYRHHNGPFSTDLWNDYDALTVGGFLNGETFKPSDRGCFLLDLVIPEIRSSQAWATILPVIDSQLDYCRYRTGAQLIADVYNLEISPVGQPEVSQRIELVPQFTDLLDPSPGGPALPDWLLSAVTEELAMSSADLARSVDQARLRESELIDRLLS